MTVDEGLPQVSWETEQRSIRSGKFFWHVGLPGKSDTKIFLWSSNVEIGYGGSLLMYDPQGKINLLFAPGEWKYVYMASVFDGRPLAVEFWPKTQRSKHHKRSEY